MLRKNTRPAMVFALLCAASVVAIAATILFATVRAERSRGIATPIALQVSQIAGSNGVVSPARLYFRHNGLGPHYGKLAEVAYGGGVPATAFIDNLECESVHVAAGKGICLAANRGVVTTYSARLFETAAYEVSAELPLPGVPSRTRVSPDGSLGATTVFVTGHGYDSVDFSTQTLLLDLRRAAVLADLETFSVLEKGTAISGVDFNFWGVTFTPDNSHFYATLSTAGRHMLVKGTIADRRVDVLRDNVECPSLSPDGTRVAYKRRFVQDGRIGWQLHVLDLASSRDTPLAERRSVDDQLEWLDNNHVLYSVASEGGASGATDVWFAAADGSGSPAVFLRDAYSPAVVR